MAVRSINISSDKLIVIKNRLVFILTTWSSFICSDTDISSPSG
ncbi:MAG: hypothetical protein OP8BY_0997 [Candidatus Saccharicenans subterraneus]|uniref:Uncharacterized protein n=1 Tax=Candidatus Saccharicenans subterraneus TaxID=2508984 RepID=A0A3E2BQP0_9BACT|nr:MAG: hypothetical protein OP8BY_0997 [Candidatus Saccharicenans subterraneum]